MPESHASSRPEDGRVRVLLPLPLDGAYDYLVPADMAVEPGSFVVVPLGRRELVGVVWGAATDEVAREKLKPIVELLDVPKLPAVTLQFVDWVANYSMALPGLVLRMCMSVRAALEPPVPQTGLVPARDVVAEESGVRLTPGRQRVLDVLRSGPAMLSGDLAREAGVSPAVVRGLIDAGLIETVDLPLPKPAEPDPRFATPSLEPAQREAADALVKKTGGGFSVTLLDGVTGSGKTAVYLEAVAAALRDNKQVLVLLPEIALTAQLLERFTERFGTPPVEWHSDLTGPERRRNWRWVAEGSARVVVGARSALFLPYRELGLILVDEEHESAFKQEDGVIYQARDMAVVRAQLGDIPAILVSATPSLETVQNAVSGRYDSLHLPARALGASLPTVEAIDLRRDRPPRQRWLSDRLRMALEETLAAKEQSLLFLNRRGYAPLTLCRHCGFRVQCPNCTAWLVEHRFHGRLACHHCGYSAELPSACPQCGTQGEFAACGPGVERLAEEVAALFPEARLAVMTSDTIWSPKAAAELVQRVTDHEIDVLIGTQIVAKGHHFPLLTLVGVVDADLGLGGGDLRAAERTYQLLHQVSGRAGRADRPGRVLLQTSDPAHPVMQALLSGDREAFLESESDQRRRYGLPPFGRLAALIVSAGSPHDADEIARDIARRIPTLEGFQVLGPAPAPLAVLRGWHRRRFLIKCRREQSPQVFIRRWFEGYRLPSSARLQVDIDPYSFL
jgi:primosomal protein N' (replication factor Y)